MELSLPDKALAYASVWHKNQFRKRSGLPYIVHPISVANTVADIINDSSIGAIHVYVDLVSAAYLHDVVEDCFISYDVICEEFNQHISNLVRELTAPKFTQNTDKDNYILQSMSGMSLDALTIKLADRLDNVQDAKKYGWDSYLRRTNKIMKKLNDIRDIPKNLFSIYREIMRITSDTR